MGPMIKAEVGDTIEVVFKNLATRPYSVHPHGILYRYIWLLIRIHSCSLCTLGEVNEVYFFPYLTFLCRYMFNEPPRSTLRLIISYYQIISYDWLSGMINTIDQFG